MITYNSASNDDRLISRDGSATTAIIVLEATDEESIDLVDDLRALLQPRTG